MAELSTSRLWLMRLGFVALALVIMFFHLLPLDTVPRRWAPPDLLVAFVFAWALRRPDYVPILSLAIILLLLICYGAGLLTRKAFGRAISESMESKYPKG